MPDISGHHNKKQKKTSFLFILTTVVRAIIP